MAESHGASTPKKSKPVNNLYSDESNIESQMDDNKKVTDLNFDCLKEIFKYLTIRDLVHLAEAHFPDGLANVNESTPFEECIRKAFSKQQDDNEFIISNKTDFNLQMLHHFGPLITKIDLYHSDNHQYDKEVENAIIKHCRTTLTGFTFHFVGSHVINETGQPFENVQNVKFVGGHLGTKISQFNKWFPRMTSLQIFGVSIEDLQCVREHFPFLEHFAVCNDLGGYELDLELERTDASFRRRFFNSPLSNFDNLSVEAIIKLNPQLKSLCITHNENHLSKDTIKISSDLLKCIEKNLPNLESLSLNVKPGDEVDLRENVEFKNLKKLQIGAFHDRLCFDVYGEEYTDEPYITANNLQVLKLSGVLEDEPEYEFISTFICNFPSIRELEFTHFDDFDIAHENMQVMYNFMDHLEAIYVFDDNENDKKVASHYLVSRKGRKPKGLFAGVKIDQVQ